MGKKGEKMKMRIAVSSLSTEEGKRSHSDGLHKFEVKT